MHIPQNAGPMEIAFGGCFPAEEEEKKIYRNSYAGIAPDVVRAVKSEAGRAIHRKWFREADRPDLEQELMLAALNAMEKYDRRKGLKSTLAHVAAKNKACSLCTYRHAAIRDFRKTISLNEKMASDEEDGDSGEFIEFVASDGQFGVSCLDVLNPARVFNLKLDVDAALGMMPEKLRIISEDLKTMSVKDVAEKRNTTRACVYRQIDKIRGFMIDAGFSR